MVSTGYAGWDRLTDELDRASKSVLSLEDEVESTGERDGASEPGDARRRSLLPRGQSFLETPSIRRQEKEIERLHKTNFNLQLENFRLQELLRSRSGAVEGEAEGRNTPGAFIADGVAKKVSETLREKEKELRDVSEQRDQWKDGLKEAKREILELQSRLEMYESENIDQGSGEEGEESRVAAPLVEQEVEETIAKLEQERDDANRAREEMEERCRGMEGDIETHLHEIAELKQRVSDLQEVQEQAMDSNKEELAVICNEESAISDLRSEDGAQDHAKSAAPLPQLEDYVETFEDFAELEEIIRTQEVEIEELKQKLEDALSCFEHLNAKYAELEDRLEETEEFMERERPSISSTNVGNMDTEVPEAKNVNPLELSLESTPSTDEIETLRNEVSSKESELLRVTEELRNMSFEVCTAEGEKADLRSQLNQLEEDHHNLRQQNEVFEVERRRYSDQGKELGRLRCQLEEIEGKLEGSEEYVRKLEKQLSDWKDLSLQLTEQKNKLEKSFIDERRSINDRVIYLETMLQRYQSKYHAQKGKPLYMTTNSTRAERGDHPNVGEGKMHSTLDNVPELDPDSVDHPNPGFRLLLLKQIEETQRILFINQQRLADEKKNLLGYRGTGAGNISKTDESAPFLKENVVPSPNAPPLAPSRPWRSNIMRRNGPI
uniref:Centrosomin N-terminal motif 1 domain-containing protein n=1 Tax=Compsopogon caeruleus TaxID=31354 RepID=A0A7S1XBA5_9RHOD|mmetsp:Transcript_12706/g.25785  ORF Transcript_12706/g.25785 Transcript_12706/m.25785 type:complete len:665 (+) Transcript_12706:211-2205(+)